MLEEAGENRTLKGVERLRSQDRPLVGVVGAAAPFELIYAANAIPVRLSARADDWARDCAPMEMGHEPEVRSLFLQAISGEFAACDLVVIPGTSDGYRYLYQYLKEMVRQGRGGGTPPLMLYDMLYAQSAAVRTHCALVFEDFKRRLEVLTGAVANDAALVESIADVNRVRMGLETIEGLRREGRLTGVDALRLIRLSTSTTLAAFLQAVAQAASSKAQISMDQMAPRLAVVSAAAPYHSCVPEQLESAGARVVAEDDQWLSPLQGPQLHPGAAPSDAVFDWSYQFAPSPRRLQVSREAGLRRLFASGDLDGVVFYVPPSDQFFGWRYPDLKAAAEAAGLATTLLRQEALDAAASPALGRQAAAFVQRLKERASQ